MVLGNEAGEASFGSSEVFLDRFRLVAGEISAYLDVTHRSAQPRHIIDAIRVVTLDYRLYPMFVVAAKAWFWRRVGGL